MKRSKPLRRTAFKRKPQERGRVVKGRYRATAMEWAEIRTRKLWLRRCRVWGCSNQAESLHHLVGRDLLGDDVIENLVEVCGDGTSGCHGKLQELDAAVCSLLRANLTEEEERYVEEKQGRAWLDRWYPKPERDASAVPRPVGPSVENPVDDVEIS